MQAIFDIFMMPVEIFKIAFALVFWGIMISMLFEAIKWWSPRNFMEDIKDTIKKWTTRN